MLTQPRSLRDPHHAPLSYSDDSIYWTVALAYPCPALTHIAQSRRPIIHEADPDWGHQSFRLISGRPPRLRRVHLEHFSYLHSLPERILRLLCWPSMRRIPEMDLISRINVYNSYICFFYLFADFMELLPKTWPPTVGDSFTAWQKVPASLYTPTERN